MTTDLATFVKRTRFPGILEARKCLGDQAVTQAIADYLEIKTSFGVLIERLKEYGLEQKEDGR